MIGLSAEKICFFPALSVAERLDAMRSLSANMLTEKLIIIISAVAIVTLTLALLYVSHHRKKEENEQSDDLFNSYAEKRGLSKRERQMLRYMAMQAGLQRLESIFTLESAFDNGSLRLIEEVSDKDQNLQVATEISLLREKLGFKKKQVTSIATLLKSRKLSTRQIPAGKEIEIIRRKGDETEEIQAEVVKNTDLEFLIKLPKVVEDPKKTLLRGRYYYGASVWEFDIMVQNSIEDNIVLQHSDDVRHINRRRFLRVPIERPGFISTYDFKADWVVELEDDKLKSDFNNMSHEDIKRPEFYPAIFKEIAGPGFLLESQIDVEVGQRIMVMFGWEEKPIKENEESNKSKVKFSSLMDIAEVKRVTTKDNNNLIALEMLGIGDSEIDELIRITNTASRINNLKNKEHQKEEALA